MKYVYMDTYLMFFVTLSMTLFGAHNMQVSHTGIQGSMPGNDEA